MDLMDLSLTGMKMKQLTIILIIVLVVLAGGCIRKTVKTVYPSLSDGRYDSEFPYRNASDEIETITHSIRKLFHVVYYTTYQFTANSHVTRSDILSGTFRRLALGTIGTHETNSGSATIIMNSGQKIALLTCAHILDSPDTLLSFFPLTANDPIEMVKSISIKEKQELFVKGFPDCGTFVTLAMDPEADIAIIGKECGGKLDSFELFNYPSGRARELEWGSFVYVFGYPLGNLMVTKGIVSHPNGDASGSFSVDALLNKGFSGGIVLAIRDGVPNFELVGMVKSISSHMGYYLKPEKNIYEFQYNEFIPYSGETYVGSEEVINYGINYVVPFESIQEFYKKNRPGLITQGYNLDPFFSSGHR